MCCVTPLSPDSAAQHFTNVEISFAPTFRAPRAPQSSAAKSIIGRNRSRHGGIALEFQTENANDFALSV